MTRPASHREELPAKSCGNCFWAAWPEYWDHLLCFHGDNAVVRPDPIRPDDKFAREVTLEDGVEVHLLEGEERDEVWGGRVVDPLTEVCDEWREGGPR